MDTACPLQESGFSFKNKVLLTIPGVGRDSASVYQAFLINCRTPAMIKRLTTRLEQLLTAAAFAEAGETEFARQLL
ncbi:hypothetical protein TspCOW1_04190 [Thiohalobacter sp. COW1]|uniref:NAD-dependent aldehyde dehydrogenases n=1 Tax=Thiohalobacter thiocyanaticus TaxID=585455 RepID=A0A1Z4VSJ1_9GAMM|nr:NAD-dependent aldehyde dehydrogenases [Thiohalobacter thiocyanaticus]BCO30316.1 hypothetical protein TspCOW1_04190 [Thiohalobacter sp. COW1]